MSNRDRDERLSALLRKGAMGADEPAQPIEETVLPLQLLENVVGMLVKEKRVMEPTLTGERSVLSHPSYNIPHEAEIIKVSEEYAGTRLKLVASVRLPIRWTKSEDEIYSIFIECIKYPHENFLSDGRAYHGCFAVNEAFVSSKV